MGALALIFITFFAAVICGAVMLIQLGGWLAILAAILILCHFFISLSLNVLFVAGSLKEKEKEKKKNEGMVS